MSDADRLLEDKLNVSAPSLEEPVGLGHALAEIAASARGRRFVPGRGRRRALVVGAMTGVLLAGGDSCRSNALRLALAVGSGSGRLHRG